MAHWRIQSVERDPQGSKARPISCTGSCLTSMNINSGLTRSHRGRQPPQTLYPRFDTHNMATGKAHDAYIPLANAVIEQDAGMTYLRQRTRDKRSSRLVFALTPLLVLSLCLNGVLWFKPLQTNISGHPVLCSGATSLAFKTSPYSMFHPRSDE